DTSVDRGDNGELSIISNELLKGYS
ncbi:hypothetical protein TorRG33x02_062100, partial [Trema orientale]